MFLSILHRMILWELVKVFVLCLVGITGIMLMAGIVAEASQQGYSPMQILAVIPLIIPSTLPYTLPSTTLFATCVVYGRLAADNEILAIKAAGINILKVVWPGFLLGLTMSGVTMGLYYRIIPYTHHLMRTMFLRDIEEVVYTMLRKDRCLNLPKVEYSIFVRQVQGKKLLNAVIKRRNKDGHVEGVAWAEEAELRFNLRRWEVDVSMHNCEIWSPGQNTGIFRDRTWTIRLPDSFENRVPKARDLTWKQILERRTALEKQEKMVIADIALTTARRNISLLPTDLDKHLKNLNVKRRCLHMEIHQMNTELQMRPSLALGCLCFVLVGCPVGIWFSRSDYLSAFITCFLPIVFVYYPLDLCCINMAKEGKFLEAPCVWIPDVVMALVGMVLYWRLLKN